LYSSFGERSFWINVPSVAELSTCYNIFEVVELKIGVYLFMWKKLHIIDKRRGGIRLLRVNPSP
jgi:hypothetical protein